MNFSKTTSYSLNILSYMAMHHDVRMSASRLHKVLDIPYSYLRQILGKLSKKGFITGIPGRNGGFIFRKDVEDIYLSDIIDATEGLESIDRCFMGFKVCPFNNSCAMHPVWEKIRARIIYTLRNTTIASLVLYKK